MLYRLTKSQKENTTLEHEGELFVDVNIKGVPYGFAMRLLDIDKKLREGGLEDIDKNIEEIKQKLKEVYS
jgi:hypothetical protein